jgi:predicted neutral ceramidase superfamily lipid hydrolase
MLFELLPHLARLMPMADKYLSTRSASDKAQEAALVALARDVRGEIARVGEAGEGVQRRLQEQSKQIAGVSVEVTRARLGVESAETRIARLEKTVALGVKLLWVVLALVAMVLALLVVLMVRKG